MEWEQALAQAEKTGGTIEWSEEKGFFVEPRHVAKKAPSYRKAPIFPWQAIGAWPWETPTGEGFNLPWNMNWLTPQNRLSQYQYGMPQLSWGAQQELQKGGYQGQIPPWLSTVEPTFEETKAAQQAEADAAMEATREGLGIFGNMPVRWDTILDEDTGMMVMVGYDEEGKVVTYEPQGLGRQAEREPTTYEEYGVSPYGEGGQFNPYTGQWEAPPGYISPYQQQQLDISERQFEWEQQQWKQQLRQAKEQRLAELAANPMSWLQYGLESGLGSQVQPWMTPLMQNQGVAAATVGQPLTTGKETDLTNLPALTRPSAQYMSRMSPSAQEQYYGYKKARTGANPDDVRHQMWMRSAPSGSFPGLAYSR